MRAAFFFCFFLRPILRHDSTSVCDAKIGGDNELLLKKNISSFSHSDDPLNQTRDVTYYTISLS